MRPDELETAGVKMKETGEVTLETEYEKVKEIDIEHWEMVRGEEMNKTRRFKCLILYFSFVGPRPWEEQPAKN